MNKSNNKNNKSIDMKVQNDSEEEVNKDILGYDY